MYYEILSWSTFFLDHSEDSIRSQLAKIRFAKNEDLNLIQFVWRALYLKTKYANY